MLNVFSITTVGVELTKVCSLFKMCFILVAHDYDNLELSFGILRYISSLYTIFSNQLCC